MRQRRLSLLLSSVAVLFLLGSAGWLALGVEAVSQLVPPGSGELRLELLTANQLHVSYRLPGGQTWRAVYDRLADQGWSIHDEGARVLWPELMDDSRTSAAFWRTGGLGLVRQSLTVRRVTTNPPVFTVEIYQCIRIASWMPCG